MEHHDTYYRITYRDIAEGKVQTLRARSISDSGLGLSFIQVSDFVFEQTSKLVNPADEALATQLKDVKSLHLSMYTIVCIEEVGHANQGLAFENDRSRLLVYPGGNDGGDGGSN